jgi:hypothetical protein
MGMAIPDILPVWAVPRPPHRGMAMSKANDPLEVLSIIREHFNE